MCLWHVARCIIRFLLGSQNIVMFIAIHNYLQYNIVMF
jgi:hypothetical protein